MAIRSVFIPQPGIDGDLIRILDEEHQHLHVARGRAEEPVEIFDGRGNVWDAVIVSIERRETVVRVTGGRQVTLGQSLIRSSAFEYALEKAVETGVTRIIPIAAARSNSKDAGRRERWQKIIIEAAKQSKRYHLPVLDEPRSFENALEIEARTKIVFAERNGGPLKPAISGSPVLYLVGPEGGWTDEELNLADRQGFSLVGLGPTILKSETAAVVATSLLRYELQRM
jgi:16S rRNA (uracil1498-N3)-methyltransferase